jgi:hypothetical protein
MTETKRLKRYNPPKRRIIKKMTGMRHALISWVLLTASGLGGLRSSAAPVPSQWEKGAAALAEQIAGIMGPGQAQLTIRNISSVPAADLPCIRKLLEQDLKAHGVLTSGAESANAIRVTLSESAHERLWVAEVVEGNETRVVMVEVDPTTASVPRNDTGIVLRKERLVGLPVSDKPTLFAAQSGSDVLVVHPDDIAIGSVIAGEWKEQKRIAFGRRQNASRDPRGVVAVAEDGGSFTAYAPGIACSGLRSGGTDAAWSVQCHEGDDPWPVLSENTANATGNLKAFFNSGRNYFTGVVTPSVQLDLPPFYSAGLLPRPGGRSALLINGIDGRVQILDNVPLKTVAGTRDWGSDFAVLHSGCGAGTQVIASGSGEASSDSLRAYEIPALEAIGVSAPLSMDGTVTALWTAPDGKSVLAVVRNAGSQYEVERVTALCN